MRITQLNKILAQRYPTVTATEKDGCVVLNGQLSDWQEVVACGQLAVDKTRYIGVLNDIVFTGADIPPMRLPTIYDNTLDGQCVDVLIIGGGISGASILRELSKYNLNLLLVEKESDLALHASGRNDGEVHPGVDLPRGTKKQYYVVRANKIYPDICRELDVPYRNCGQYVGFTNLMLKIPARIYALNRRFAGCPCKIVGRRFIRRNEPTLNHKFAFGIYNKTAGVVNPFLLTIAYAENAVTNGARVSLNTAVLSMTIDNNVITEVKTNRGTVRPRVVVNCAGVFADDIAKMANDRFFTIHPRAGVNTILDSSAHVVNSIASIKMNSKGSHTKGGGVLRTVDNNTLVGPNAHETYLKEDFSTSAEDINQVFAKQVHTTEQLRKRDIIAYFKGVRAATYEEDYYISKGLRTKNIVHCAGIQSPGLTTAPLVARDVEKMAVELLGGASVNVKVDYNPHRVAPPVLRELPIEERQRLIEKNPDYGIIVCRCEQISKGEIIDALNSPICVPTLDGVKKRCRAGMGRCQGGFCTPLVMQIIAQHQKCNLEQVRRHSSDSVIVYGNKSEVTK